MDTAGIGVWDPWVREGGFDDGSTRFPYVMGNDGAGVVVAVGPKVRRLHVGDRAYGYQMEGGFYAEYAKLKEDSAALIPKGLDVSRRRGRSEQTASRRCGGWKISCGCAADSHS